MRILLLSAIVLHSFVLSGCQSSDKQTVTKTVQTTKDVREIAWNSLTDSERKEIVGDWKDAKVSKVTADTKRFSLIDPSFDGKEVTMVTLSSKKSALLGDIIKLVDEKTQKVIGRVMRK